MSGNDYAQEELEIFLEEMDELLQVLEEDFLKLEREPDNPSILQEIFRAAHTMKGSAATMGYSKLADLAHSMETVFDGVRSGRIAVSAKLIDVFLQCNDTLGNIKNEIFQYQEVRSETAHHISDLKELIDTGGAAAEAESTSRLADSIAKSAGPENGKRFNIRLDVSESCQLPSVRAFQVVFLMSSNATLISTNPSVEDIENETGSFPLELLVCSDKSLVEIELFLSTIPEIVVQRVEETDSSAGDTLTSSAADAEGDESAARAASSTDSYSPDSDLDALLNGSSCEPQVVEDAVEEEEKAPVAVVPERKKAEAKEDSQQKEDKKSAGDSGKDKAQARKHSARTVRVDVERMDAIMDLVGELVINRTRLTQLSRTISARYDGEENVENINETADALELISGQLQENIMKARLLPIENVFNKFPRMVRDLAKKSGKKIELVMMGEDTELDRSVLEEIGDPLMHAIRNSVDHGIENEVDRLASGKSPEGTIKISASHVEDHILITVEDDGSGINPEKVLKKAKEMKVASPEVLDALSGQEVLNLVFAPGFSTKTEVSELSGRGVGMDVVRANIEKLNGSVALHSVVGDGTKLTIKLPLTLAIIKSLLVTIEKRVFAIPLVSVIQTVRASRADIQTVKGRETTLFRGSVLPLVRLEDALGITRKESELSGAKFFIVVVSWGGKRTGIVVDTLIGDMEIVIRPLGEYIGEVPGIAGAAILGDGNIALIVDIGGVIEMKAGEKAAV